MICVSISRIDQLPGLIESGLTLLELRLDLIKEDPGHIYQQIPDHVQTIATCRPEGYTESERIELLKTCMDLGANFIDLEIESTDDYLTTLTAHARQCGTQTIISYHNFESTPDERELEHLLQKCYDRGGNVAKIAVQVNTMKDLHHLLGLYKLPGKKVVLGMGKLGRVTRIMGPYLGAEFTFGAPGTGSETAPGQFSYIQLTDIFKVINES
jgi:3-dehydroquinate dehydratase-1